MSKKSNKNTKKNVNNEATTIKKAPETKTIDVEPEECKPVIETETEIKTEIKKENEVMKNLKSSIESAKESVKKSVLNHRVRNEEQRNAKAQAKAQAKEEAAKAKAKAQKEAARAKEEAARAKEEQRIAKAQAKMSVYQTIENEIKEAITEGDYERANQLLESMEFAANVEVAKINAKATTKSTIIKTTGIIAGACILNAIEKDGMIANHPFTLLGKSV